MPLRLLPYAPERDVYRLLQVDPAADTDEIAAACRRLSRAFHPDRNRSARATEEMQVVNEVRRVMTDPETRAEYDVARLRWFARVTPRPVPLDLAGAPARMLDGGWRMTDARGSARYARAALVGARAMIAALAPRRCTGCRMVVTEDDIYCAACGRRLAAAG